MDTVDHSTAAALVEANQDALAVPLQREVDAPPGSFWRAGKGVERRVGEPGADEGSAKLSDFPVGIRRVGPMLERAATARAEMRAWRDLPVGGVRD